LALGARLAAISFAREYVEAGALMSYGPNYVDLLRKAAEYVDKILRGAKPGRSSSSAADQVRAGD
jgi:putative ABC transport system substrate-binding protein